MFTKLKNKKLGVFSGTYLCKVSQERKKSRYFLGQ